jgi:hypothetical protein
MTVHTLASRITRFGFDLIAEEFALDARYHRASQVSASSHTIVWDRDPRSPVWCSCPATLADYRAIIASKDYSYLLMDGAVVQVLMTFDRGSIAWHRLHYFPSPFRISEDLLADFDGGLLEFIDEVLQDDLAPNIVSRSPFRFDFDPENAGPLHPASHLTINEESCRIPARAPLSFDTFMKFILENFYPDVLFNERLRNALNFEHEPDCLSNDDRSRTYLQWSYR